MKKFYNVHDVMDLLGVKSAKAYKIIRELNMQLSSDGFMTIPGKINVSYFEKKFGYIDTK